MKDIEKKVNQSRQRPNCLSRWNPAQHISRHSSWRTRSRRHRMPFKRERSPWQALSSVTCRAQRPTGNLCKLDGISGIDWPAQGSRAQTSVSVSAPLQNLNGGIERIKNAKIEVKLKAKITQKQSNSTQCKYKKTGQVIIGNLKKKATNSGRWYAGALNVL